MNKELCEKLRTYFLKIISVVRNPKDVAHSFYNLMKWTNQAHTYTLEDYVDKFVKGDGLYYWNHKHRSARHDQISRQIRKQ